MADEVEVRRIRADEWREVRDLRIDAVNDPDAAIAFLSTIDDELAHDEEFWRARAAGAADGRDAAQFVAIAGDRWVGTAAFLARDGGSFDHLCREVAARRADVVGVFVRPEHRGTGILGRLVDAGADWAAAQGIDALTLDVHADNHRAQAAYRKLGFAPTGVEFTSVIGPEREMRRPPRDDSPR